MLFGVIWLVSFQFGMVCRSHRDTTSTHEEELTPANNTTQSGDNEPTLVPASATPAYEWRVVSDEAAESEWPALKQEKPEGDFAPSGVGVAVALTFPSQRLSCVFFGAVGASSRPSFRQRRCPASFLYSRGEEPTLERR